MDRPTTGVEPGEPASAITYSADANLILTAVEVPRYGVDLRTFQSASALELERDPRFHIASTQIDGTLRNDGRPVSVLDFSVGAPASTIAADSGNGASTVTIYTMGRQYAIAHPDGARFVVLTCLATAEAIDDCDEKLRKLEISDEP